MLYILSFFLITINFNYFELFNFYNANIKYFLKILPISLIFLFFFFNLKKNNYNLAKILNIYKPIIILYFFGVISCLWSANVLLSLERSIFSILTFLSIFFLSLFIFNTSNKSLIILKISSLLSILFATIFSFKSLNVGNIVNNYERLGNFLIHPNSLGIFIGLSILFFSVDLIIEKKKKLFNVLIIFFLFYLMLLTGSRSSIFISITTLILTFYFSQIKIINKLLIIYLLIIISLVIFNLDIFDNFYLLKSIIFRGQEVQDLVSLNNRTQIWKSLSFNGLNLIFGNGFFMLSKDEFLNLNGYMINHAHNGFVQIYASLGLIGCFLIFLFLKNIIIYFNHIKEFKNKLLFFSFVIYYLLSNLTISGFGFHFFPHVILFNLTICLLVHINEN